MIALAEQGTDRGGASLDLLADADAAVDELQSIGAVRRRGRGAVFTHPLLRTTALDLAPPELVVEVAGELLDLLDSADGRGVAAGTLVRLSDAARRTGDDHHTDLVRAAYDEAILHGSWSAAGDLAESLLETAGRRGRTCPLVGADRTSQVQRARSRRGHRAIDRRPRICTPSVLRKHRERQRRRISTVAQSASCWRCARTSRAEAHVVTRSSTSSSLSLISDESIDRHWRAQSAAILAELSWAAPRPDERGQFVDKAQELVEGVDDPCHAVPRALCGRLAPAGTARHRWRAAVLHTRRQRLAPAGGSVVVQRQPRPDGPLWGCWRTTRWRRSAMPRRRRTCRHDSSNWAEHGYAVAIRSVAATRLGRLADADNDTESSILSARRADSAYPFLETLPTAIWRRAVRGDEAGVAVLREVARQQQIYMPFAELIAVSLLRGVDEADAEIRPRWSLPRNGLSFRNIGFHAAQFEAAVLAGNLEVVDGLFVEFDRTYQTGRASKPGLAQQRGADDGRGRHRARRCLGKHLARSRSGVGSSRPARTSSRRSSTSYRSRYAFAEGRGDQDGTGSEDAQRSRASMRWGRRCLPGCNVIGSPRSSANSACRRVANAP